MIKIGQSLPEAKFKIWSGDEMTEVTTHGIFDNRRIVLFAVPGAFTPTCSNIQLPSFAQLLPALKERGIDDVVCVAVNDAFVLKAWAQSQDVDGQITMLADGNAEFTRAIGMELDGTGFGLGIRSQRYSMVVHNGIVKDLHLEENPGVCEQTRGEHILENL